MTAASVVPTLQDPTTGNRPPGALFGASCERRARKSTHARIQSGIGDRLGKEGGFRQDVAAASLEDQPPPLSFPQPDPRRPPPFSGMNSMPVTQVSTVSG